MAHALITKQPMVNHAEMRRSAHLLVLSAIWRAVAGAASRVAAWHARRRRMKDTVTTLSRLNNRMLRDIGIEPGEIERAAARACRDAIVSHC